MSVHVASSARDPRDHDQLEDELAALPGRPDRPGNDDNGGHGHLWRLPDGTGLHAPSGTLTRDPDTGEVCCHLCGRWFRALGSHVRVHGYTAASYRAAMGLYTTRPLTAPDFSAAIAERQRSAYQRHVDFRRRLEAGHELARRGQLTWLAVRRASSTPPSPQLRTGRLEHLALGRASAAARREQRLRETLDQLGFPDLATYLRQAYAAGDSLATLARATGLGRERLRAALSEAGVEVRKPGTNTPTGRQSRADAAAAHRVGTDDLRGWLAMRREAGASLSELGVAVGHSYHWVRRRLNHNDT